MSIAEAKARLLIKTYQPQYPLNIKEFVKLLGLDKPVEFHKCHELPDEVSALVIDKEWYENIHILTNANHPVTRQRFGSVHELAHIYLGHKGGLHFYSPGNIYGEDPIEHCEADIFATELLMPIFHVFELAGRIRSPLSLLKAMETAFKVSLEAAARRVIELEIYKKAACILLRDGQPVFTYATNDFYCTWEMLADFLGEIFTLMKPGQRKVWVYNELAVHTSRMQKGYMLVVLVGGRADLNMKVAEVL
ncbi:MAG: ImmA/IrrE family metallo-endopeptidase [Moorella sp. (in: firmicutes)]|jgi:hypothetical protein|uniref:IrrE N-terminal-like domain-containing protein n=1 Tax=Moorella mulderi DSM 14980 TaxID=1122241 RepID=A0A151AV40_9FIRM|nr:ImmA/IrrE family metallo-endopeptidase [Moorella mulderi]KYH31534.1 hypothetical protein MOMUL_22740 [Moorella mulderi DSM 14980]